MRKFTTIISFSAALLGSSMAIAQEAQTLPAPVEIKVENPVIKARPAPAIAGPQHIDQETRQAHFQRSLGLTDEQVEMIQQERVKMHAAMRAASDEFSASLDNILTPEQAEKFEQLKDKMRQGRFKRIKQHHHKPEQRTNGVMPELMPEKPSHRS